PKTKEKNTKKVDHRAPGAEEDDSELQRAWGALIKEKEQSRQKKSRCYQHPFPKKSQFPGAYWTSFEGEEEGSGQLTLPGP
ncbi:NCBP3 isoform 6, partial [Pan troglodytes]